MLLRVQAQPVLDGFIKHEEFPGLRCSRLLVCLEYTCTSERIDEYTIIEELHSTLTMCWSKSEAYNSMFRSDPVLKANDVSLLDEIYYLMQLFSEYHDRLELLNVEINFNGRSTMHSLKSISALVHGICELDTPRMSTVFTVIEHCDTLILVQYPSKSTPHHNALEDAKESYIMIVVSAHDAVVHSLPGDATTDDIFDIFLSIISQNSHASRNHASLPFAAVTCVREDIETTQYDHMGSSRDDFMLLLDYNLKEMKKSADAENIRRLRYQLIQLESRSHEFRNSYCRDDQDTTREKKHVAVQDMKSNGSLRSLHKDMLEDHDAVLEESMSIMKDQESNRVPLGNIQTDFSDDCTVEEKENDYLLLKPYEQVTVHPITRTPTPKEMRAEDKYERTARSSQDSSKMSKSEDKHISTSISSTGNENKLHLLSITSPIRVSLSKDRSSASKGTGRHSSMESNRSLPPAGDSKQSGDMMSSSLVSELLRSQEDENILSYISRAYNCIRDRVVLDELNESSGTVDNNLHSTIQSTLTQSMSKSQIINVRRPFTAESADNLPSDQLLSSSARFSRNSDFKNESKIEYAPSPQGAISLGIVATTNSGSDSYERKGSPELADHHSNVKSPPIGIPDTFFSPKKAEYQEPDIYDIVPEEEIIPDTIVHPNKLYSSLSKGLSDFNNDLSESMQYDSVRLSKTSNANVPVHLLSANDRMIEDRSQDNSPARKSTSSHYHEEQLPRVPLKQSELLDYSVSTAQPAVLRVSAKFDSQEDGYKDDGLANMEVGISSESFAAAAAGGAAADAKYDSSSRNESRSVDLSTALRIPVLEDNNESIGIPPSSPTTAKAGIHSNVSSPSKPTSTHGIEGHNSYQRLPSPVAEKHPILSVPSEDFLDSKKQSIITKELISRLESSKILIEYNFYLKAVKQNQVRIEMGRQVLERFRSSVQSIPARQATSSVIETSTTATTSSSGHTRDIADRRVHVEVLKVGNSSSSGGGGYSASNGDTEIVAASDRGQFDSVAVNKGAGGRKVVTFGNPQGERASSAPSTSRMKVSDNVREIHSPGNPWTGGPHTRSPITNISEYFQPSQQVESIKLPERRVGGIVVHVGEERSSPIADAVSAKRRAHSASAASRRQQAGSTPTPQPAAVGGACNKYNNYQQVKNAVAAVCLAGPQFEVQRTELFDRLEYYFTNGKRTPQLLVQVQSCLSNEVPLVLELKGKINQFIIMFYKSKILSFKGIYIMNPINGCVEKIFGRGPKELLDSTVSEYLKFESSSKSFKNLPVKSFSSAVDGVIIDAAKRKNCNGPTIP